MKHYALVLLCGGQSTRMGCDKAFLPFGDGSLLHYQIGRFRPYFEKIYLSVPAHRERPVDYAAISGCPAIEDAHSAIGPMGGLFACLCSAPEEILFFTSVDAPFTDPKLAAALCEKLAKKMDKGYRICTISSASGGVDRKGNSNCKETIQPLFSAYTKDCLPDIRACIEQKNYRLRQLFDPAHTLVYRESPSEDTFFNMNDPSSYYRALARLAHENPATFPADFFKHAAQDSPACDPAVSLQKPLQTGSAHKIIPVVSFSARSGTGKTTYLEKLIPLLTIRGLRVAVVKHDAHGFEIDQPGKDSYRLTHAGAAHMILTSTDQTAAIFTHPGQNQSLDSLIGRIKNVDLILTEGYKFEHYPKIHLLRKGYQETPVGDVSTVIAYAADFPYQADVPVFDLNRPEDMVEFLLKQTKRNR